MCLPTKTLFTGLAPGISATGAIVDPLNLTGAFGPKKTAPPPPDPAIERATAEAQAAQRANAQLTANNKRRREQNSLMSKGAPAAPSFSMGDSTTDAGTGTLSSTGATTRNTTAQRAASLISRGAPSLPTAPRMYPGPGGRPVMAQ